MWLDDQGEERIKELKDQMHQLEEENDGLKRDVKKLQSDIDTLEGTTEGGEELIQNGFLLPPSLLSSYLVQFQLVHTGCALIRT